jgi:hypothetical protein
MAQGLIERYERAGEEAPLLMYVDRDCCQNQGPSSVERLFADWVEAGMAIRLDPWHWIHRFDAAVRTDSHPKYSTFKSALSVALFAYNKADLDLVTRTVHAGSSDGYKELTDAEISKLFISKYCLQHYVRRVTVGAQQTFALVDAAIEELKGQAGLDENEISLLKSNECVDEIWARQQYHLECIQDPPEMNMYITKKHVNMNGVDFPYYGCIRGNNSLEGFHAHLPRMIPGDHCAIRPFQIYLLTDLARWNSNRQAEMVQGGKGRKYTMYQTDIIHRLNSRSAKLFGETGDEELNFQPPAPSDQQ